MPKAFDLSNIYVFLCFSYVFIYNLDLFYNVYNTKPEKLNGYQDLLSYIYEMGENMKMISLRQIDINMISKPNDVKSNSLNDLKFDQGFINIKKVIISLILYFLYSYIYTYI